MLWYKQLQFVTLSVEQYVGRFSSRLPWLRFLSAGSHGLGSVYPGRSFQAGIRIVPSSHVILSIFPFLTMMLI